MRMLWFGLGVAAGVAASRKASAAARRMTPAGAAENVSDAMRELAAAVGAFGAEVRAARHRNPPHRHRHRRRSGASRGLSGVIEVVFTPLSPLNAVARGGSV